MIFKFKDKKYKFKWPKTPVKREWSFKENRRQRFDFDYFLPFLIILEIVVFSVVFALIFRLPCVKIGEKEAEAPAILKGQTYCLEGSTSTIYAAMIDNMLEGRPSVGLSQADLVYEAPAEAGITRFLAVYCVEKIPLNPPLVKGETEGDFPIGPVRSLRPYYLDWAEELGVPVAHVGGSPEAWERLKNASVPDLDQWYNGKYFWRSKNRAAPHNVFTTLANLEQFKKDKFSDYKSERDAWKYKEDFADASAGFAEMKSVAVDYLRPEHLVRWVYSSSTNSYARFQNDARHCDEDGKEISAKNIVIQITKMEILDEIGRRKIETTGAGKTMIFQDGKVIEGIWKRPNKESRTIFYDSAGNEIEFNKGATWIEVVANYHKITIEP